MSKEEEYFKLSEYLRKELVKSQDEVARLKLRKNKVGPYGESFGNLIVEAVDEALDSPSTGKIVRGQKDTAGKPDLTLIPYNSLVAVARVREYGNKKYKDPWMWRINAKPKDVKDFVAAALRHINKYTDPLEHYRDDESNLHHLWHAATSLLMAISIEQDFDLDDKQHFDGN